MKRILTRFIKRLWNSPTFTTWAGFLSKSLYGVLLLPLVTTRLSSGEISVWLLLNIFFGLQALGDLGFGTTFSRAFSHAYGGATSIVIYNNLSNKKEKGDNREEIDEPKPNWKLIEIIYNNTKVLYFLLSIILVILFGIIGYYSLKIPIHNLSNIKSGWLSFVIILIGIFFNFNGSVYRLFLQGINEVAVLQRNQAIISIITVLAASFVVLTTKSLFAVVLTQQLGIIVFVVVLKFLAKKFYFPTSIKNSFHSMIDIPLIKSIFPIAWRSWVGVLMSYGLIQSSGIVIAQFGNPAQTSSYLFSIKILDVIKGFANAPFVSKMPYMNQLFVKKKEEKLLKLAFERMKISLTIFVAFTGLLIFFGKPVLTLIGSNVQLVSQNILFILMIGYFIERYGAFHTQLYSFSNNIIWHITNGITGILFIVFSFVFIHYIKNTSLAFALAILFSYLSFYGWYSAHVSYKFYKMDFLSTEYKTTLMPFVIVLLTVVLYYLV